MIIGLTGQIGAGKSAAGRILAGLGALVVDADLIGRQVVDQSPELRKKLVKAFGDEILDRKRGINRGKLAALAFTDLDSRDKLNRIVHPFLLKELRKQVKAGRRTHEVVVIDAALLLFWRMDREADLVLVIHASRQSRVKRMRARGITARDTLAREKAQLPYSEFQRRSDRLILNNGTIKDLERKIRCFWQENVVAGRAVCH